MRPLQGLLVAGAIATALTLLIAWPVVVAPNEVIFGHEILGRQPDAYALIHQFGGGAPAGYYGQPLTDFLGRSLATIVSPVFAFNLVVLLTFPLTAMATYAFARYLFDSHAGALVAGLAFAFAPMHLAQAAYHADLAQLQWLPLFFLALVALVDRVTVLRVVAFAAATLCLIFSSYYWALVGALLAPVALTAFWVIRPDADRNLKPVVAPAVIIAALAIGLGWYMKANHLGPFVVPDGVPMPIEEVAFYRARWWSYLIPSVDHPLLGAWATETQGRRNINLEMLEQQISIGFSFLLLAVAGLLLAAVRLDRRWRLVAAVAAVAIAAFAISVSPSNGSCDASLAPGCLMHPLLPALRDYGRFAAVVGLMVSVAAGAGVMLLLQGGTGGKVIAVALLALGTFEFLPLPARAHDVLPSSGHRWIAGEASAQRTLDCFPNIASEQSIPWLMPRPISLLGPAVPTCGDPQLGEKLAALDYTHVIARERNTTSRLPKPLPPGITVVKELADATVYGVSKTLPPLALVSADGFYPWEHTGDDWWRWMSPTGTMVMRNSTTKTMRVELSLDLIAIGGPRTLSLTVDGAPGGTAPVPVTRTVHTFGPFDLAPGDHRFIFAADGPPLKPSDVEDSKDNRQLTVAFRNDRWSEK